MAAQPENTFTITEERWVTCENCSEIKPELFIMTTVGPDVAGSRECGNEYICVDCLKLKLGLTP